jgi:dienelactone hydrolase
MARNGYAHMVLDHTVAQLREIYSDRAKRLGDIRTKKQALAYQDHVRGAIVRGFGPRPGKTALNAQITGVLERPTHRIENILFESRPGCLVTGNLYIPKKLAAPAPGVIGTCGHSATGKREGLYQGFCQRLVRNGFVVFIVDPFNQGERDQYFGVPNRESVQACTRAHNMMGKQMELFGEWFGAWRGWDKVRALDYLLTRPEVDSTRIGLTGNSGGGTMTTWTWAYEPRFTMAAPSCFVTSFLNNLENELPADSEQYPPGVIGAGLDIADFLIARAPNPIMMLGQTYDFFDRRGLELAYKEVKRFYKVLKAPEDSVGLFIGPQGHGYSRHNQEAMVSFFSRHAGKGKVTRLAKVDELGEDLNVTPDGEVIPAGAMPVFEMIREKAQNLAVKRPGITAAQLRTRITKLLNLPDRGSLPHYRVLRAGSVTGNRIARYAIETEGHIRALLHKYMDSPHTHSLDVEKEVHLYLPHTGSEIDMAEDRLAMSLQKRHPIYALDTRGLGESLPDEGGKDFFESYGMDYLSNGYGIMLGESLLGRRVHDLLSTIDLLCNEGARKIHLYGRGQGSLIALFGSVIDPRIKSVVLKNAPLSYQSWAKVPLVSWPNANILRGALKEFDLPDCYRALGRKLQLIQLWGPDMQPIKGRTLKSDLEKCGLSGDLIIRS